jgi:hypothetical protein
MPNYIEESDAVCRLHGADEVLRYVYVFFMRKVAMLTSRNVRRSTDPKQIEIDAHVAEYYGLIADKMTVVASELELRRSMLLHAKRDCDRLITDILALPLKEGESAESFRARVEDRIRFEYELPRPS